MLFLNDINRLVWQFTIIATITTTTATSSIITVELFLDLLEQLVELVTTTGIVYSTSINETQEDVKTSELLIIVALIVVVVRVVLVVVPLSVMLVIETSL